eukprot:3630440-Pyramimonas_sp.AAC.1
MVAVWAGSGAHAQSGELSCVQTLNTRQLAAVVAEATRTLGGEGWGCLLYTSDAADDTPCVDL